MKGSLSMGRGGTSVEGWHIMEHWRRDMLGRCAGTSLWNWKVACPVGGIDFGPSLVHVRGAAIEKHRFHIMGIRRP